MGSDASKTSLGDYNKFAMHRFNHMTHAGTPDALSQYSGPAEHGPAMYDSHQMDANGRGERAAQKLLANDSSPIGLSVIGVSLLTLAAMLGVRIRRGLQHESDMSVALAPSSADGILELKAQQSTIRSFGWSQLSSEDSCSMTLCYAAEPSNEPASQAAPESVPAAPMTSLEVAAPATMPAAPAAPPPQPKSRITQKRTENWSDLALPFADRPSVLQRDLAADAGFDPLSMASSKVQLYDYREAEIKHARLAMLAAAGWPLAELWDTGLAKTFGLRPIIEENNGLAPSVLNGGMGMVSPVYWVAVLALAAGVEAISEYKKSQAKAADSNWMHTGSYVPGNLGFDPLGLYTVFGKNESGKMLMETAEIKNGRLAMLAITAYALEEAITKTPVVQNSAFLFEPFWKTVENLMFNAPPLYTQ